MPLFLSIFLSGGLGVLSRYGIGLWASSHSHWPTFWITLLINVIGSLAIGIVSMHPSREFFLILGTGFLGGFTTFSAFSLENLRLMQSGQGSAAVLNILLSVGLGLLACVTGMTIASAVGR